MDDRVVGGERLELVRSGDEGQRGQRGDLFGYPLPVTLGRVEAGAHCSAAQRQRVQMRQRELEVLERMRQLRDVTGELLTQRQRRRVLQVGAADLDDVFEGLRFLLQR